MGDTEIKPMRTIRLVLSYVARWPFRHIYGSAWLGDHFDTILAKVGGKCIRKVYGLEFRDNRIPPKIDDLFLVSLMQAIILLGLVALSWWAWKLTNDYVSPAFLLFSVFHVIPSEQDFLTSGTLASRVPNWLTPLTSALSFVVSLPAMVIALPAVIVWGCIGWIKMQLLRPAG
ncbi:MAG: hypothetical protein AAFV59_02790 [Pseudomonadota bacterium]